MSSAGWFRGRSFELIHTRSVFVRVNPTPTTLSERRAVLHALQRHGTVEVFKRLPAPSSFICAYLNRQEAVDMLNKSPMTFKFVPEPLQSIQPSNVPGSSSISVASPIDLHIIEDGSDTVKREQADPSTAVSDPIKTFTLWVKPSGSSYNHKTNIRRNPIHGPWPEAKKSDHDFVYYALKEVVPDSIAQQCLCDWTTGGQLSEDVKLARADEEGGGVWQIRERIERRRNREKASVDDHELTRWTSLKAALQTRDDGVTEAFTSASDSNTKSGNQPSEAGSRSETVSEPLRMDRPQNEDSDSLQNHLEGGVSWADQAPKLDAQRNVGDSMAKSASKESLQKILEMPVSSKMMPSSDPSLASLRSVSDDENVAQDMPLRDGKST